MWLWASELSALGFRRKSEGYWQCKRRFGLPDGAHLSLFSWNEQALPSASRDAPVLVELSAFHVTFVLRHEHVHFYYHEHLENDWDPGGHTSRAELRRLGANAGALRGQANAVAAALVEALGGTFRSRDG
ncbi:MAG TPA: hypothetical protein VKA46_22125 [Gemmataceae bacterium]|nr:hypothetical protein [Gemmataceae bacterium]